MSLRKVLITGSCGLVGSEAVRFFTDIGATVTGIDNDGRGGWFGRAGSTKPVREALKRIPTYRHHDISVINKMVIDRLVQLCKPDLIIHCAAQPSHDKSAEIPFEDFMTNATGTVNMLEAARTHCPETPFVFVSTNKVYGDGPNRIKLRESIAQWNYDDDRYLTGIDESFPIDQSMHSPFGASKAAADLMVQEYGRYYGLPTACFRCGCVTGAGQQGVELHGFLSHLCRTAVARKPYTIYGHKGKQVRDNIHASDLVAAFHEFAKSPKRGEVYNLGGGRDNATSVISAIARIKDVSGLEVETSEAPARKGDHIVYYTDYAKFQRDYPNWRITKGLDDIMEELVGGAGLTCQK